MQILNVQENLKDLSASEIGFQTAQMNRHYVNPDFSANYVIEERFRQRKVV